MNIFVLHESPFIAATLMSDKHVSKMIIESAQMLSTAHYVIDGRKDLYKPTHVNHPCTKWARQSRENYFWLYMMFIALSLEFTKRRNKKHKTYIDLSERLGHAPSNMPARTTGLPSDFPVCVPEKYKIENDAITSYRAYYENEKLFTEQDKTRYFERLSAIDD